MSQLHLFKKTRLRRNGEKSPGRPRQRPQDCFGGAYFKTYNPREARPISSKKALHLTLKSSQATGRFSMKRHEFKGRIWEVIERHAQRNGVRIYDYANAGNHLHLLIRVKRQDDYRRFIRAITGVIARLVKGCQKGSPLTERFWEARPFTRMVSFAGNQFKTLKLYFARNRFEALGFIRYQPRVKGRTSSEWKAFWSQYVVIP